MTGYQKVKRQLLPLIKGLPVIAATFLIALFLAYEIIQHSTTQYQTVAKIELDDERYGFSGTNLYGDFDLFSAENKIETEAEVLQSQLIVNRALDQIELGTMIYRVGKLKNTLLYDDAPITISYDAETLPHKGLRRQLDVLDPTSFTIHAPENNPTVQVPGRFGVPVLIDGVSVVVHRNDSLLENRGIDLLGTYELRLLPRHALIQELLPQLQVKAIDKEIAILRVVFKDEHPQRATDFTNALCHAYIHDYVSTRTDAASKTVQFIDAELEKVSAQLQNAETELERFKTENGVVNTRQETETGLRKLSKLEVQLINTELNEQAIRQLQAYIDSGNYFDETAISFGFGDLLMAELVKKLKLWQDERHDLLLKYTADHEKVVSATEKINEIKAYIREGIKQNLAEIELKKREIEAAVEEASHEFDDLPTREKRQHTLERDFRLLEEVYNFLSEKRVEAAIATSANFTFHRVIQQAERPQEPVSPNKVLIKFVAGLFGLIFGITIVYTRKFALARISSREDLERHSALPVAGSIRKNNQTDDFDSLIKGLLLKNVIASGQVICIASALREEGKSYVASHLTSALQRQGFSATCYGEESENNSGLSNTAEALKSLQHANDFVVVDASPTAIDIRGIEAMKLADCSLFLFRANHTGLSYATHADLIVEEFGLENVHLVLNAAHIASNYSGAYVGSRFRRNQGKLHFWPRIKQLFNTYVSS